MDKAKILAVAAIIAVSSLSITGNIPSGHVYAQVAGQMDKATYDRIIRFLKDEAKYIKVAPSFLITWIGPNAN